MKKSWLLGDASVISDQDRFRALSKEYAQLEDVVAGFKAYQQAQVDLDSAKEMLEEDDAEMREMAQEEMKAAKAKLSILKMNCKFYCQKDPDDDKTPSLRSVLAQAAMKRRFCR